MLHNYFIFFTATLFSLALSFDLQTFKIDIENKLIRLRDTLQSNFQNFCQEEDAPQACPTLSYDMCSATSEKQCIQNFPTHSSCVGEGAYLSTLSSIRYPNHIYDSDQFSQLDYHFTCTTALMEKEYDEIGKDRDKKFSFIYIASRSGALRCFPGFSDTGIQGCTDYDSRARPWYISSLSGYKNLIVMLDSSVSMAEQNRLGAGIAAIKAILNTAGQYDFIKVMHFNENITSVYSTQFHQITPDFRDALTYEVAYITASSAGSNYQLAFTTIGQAIQQAKTQGASCKQPQNIVFFLSSGNITKGKKTAEDLKTIISSYATNNRIRLFTYALGNNPETDVLQQLSCEFGGMTFNIEGVNTIYEIITITGQYYNFIYSGYEKTVPTWSSIYEDTFGYGRLITVSLPVYYTNFNFRQFLGLICFDIIVPQLEKAGATLYDIQGLNSIEYTCQKYEFTPCEMQRFRGQSNLPMCASPATENDCQIGNGTVCRFYESNFKMIKDGVNESSDRCCGLTVGGVVGIVLGLVSAFLVVGLFIYQINKKKIKKMKRRQKKFESLKRTIQSNLQRKRELRSRSGRDNKVENDVISSEESVSKRVLKKGEQDESKAVILDRKQQELFFQEG